VQTGCKFTLVLASIVAPVSSNNATMPLRPHFAATCSGVIEFCKDSYSINQSTNQSISHYLICSKFRTESKQQSGSLQK